MSRKATQKHKKGHSIRRQCASKMLRVKGKRPLDQIQESIKKNRTIEDIEKLPAGGKFSCIKCDVYYRDQNTLDVHFKTKAHKRRSKEFDVKQHCSKDAEMAAGLF